MTETESCFRVSLSRPMAAILIGPSRGPRPIHIEEYKTLRALRARGLIYFDRNMRPRESIATDKGRDVIAGLLATQADSLVGAGIETTTTMDKDRWPRSLHLMWHRITDISEVPTDRDIRIAVIVEKYVHELPFPCRRVGFTWVASSSRKPVVIYPTHWQEW